MIVHFEHDGTAYNFDADDLSYVELAEINRLTGLTMTSLYRGLSTDSHAPALLAMLYIAKQRAGETVSWDELQEVRPYHLGAAWQSGYVAALEKAIAEKEAESTPAAGAVGNAPKPATRKRAAPKTTAKKVPGPAASKS